MTIQSIPVRHIAQVLVSNVDKKSVEGEWPVRLVNYMDVYYRRRITPELPLMTATASLDQLARFRLRAGDSIITKDSETTDDIAVPTHVAGAEPDMVSGYHLAILRPKSGTDPRYLTWALHSGFVRGQYAVAANGMTRYGLTYDAIESANVPMPNETTQRRIADFLDDQVARIDNIIAARRSQMHLLERESRAALDAMFDRAETTRSTRLGRFVRRIEQGWSPQCEAIPAGDQEWGVTKVSAVRPGRFVSEENKRLPDDLEPLREYEIRPGDLMITRANTPGLVGAFAVAPRDVRRRLILSDKIMRVELDPALAPEYVALVGQTSLVRSRLSGAGTGTSQSMVNIRGADIRDLPIVVRARAEQSALVAARAADVAAARRGDALFSAQIDRVSELKRSLITAAVTGAFDVSSADGSRVHA